MKRAGATCCHHTAAAAQAALGDAWERAQSQTGDSPESFDEIQTWDRPGLDKPNKMQKEGWYSRRDQNPRPGASPITYVPVLVRLGIDVSECPGEGVLALGAGPELLLPCRPWRSGLGTLGSTPVPCCSGCPHPLTTPHHMQT